MKNTNFRRHPGEEKTTSRSVKGVINRYSKVREEGNNGGIEKRGLVHRDPVDTIVRHGEEASDKETVREMMGLTIKILILMDISIL